MLHWVLLGAFRCCFSVIEGDYGVIEGDIEVKLVICSPYHDDKNVFNSCDTSTFIINVVFNSSTSQVVLVWF